MSAFPASGGFHRCENSRWFINESNLVAWWLSELPMFLGAGAASLPPSCQQLRGPLYRVKGPPGRLVVTRSFSPDSRGPLSWYLSNMHIGNMPDLWWKVITAGDPQAALLDSPPIILLSNVQQLPWVWSFPDHRYVFIGNSLHSSYRKLSIQLYTGCFGWASDLRPMFTRKMACAWGRIIGSRNFRQYQLAVFGTPAAGSRCVGRGEILFEA